MEIVLDFDEQSYNNNSKPRKSSKILRVKTKNQRKLQRFRIYVPHFSFVLHFPSFFFIICLSKFCVSCCSFFHFSFHFSFFLFPFLGCSKSDCFWPQLLHDLLHHFWLKLMFWSRFGWYHIDLKILFFFICFWLFLVFSFSFSFVFVLCSFFLFSFSFLV